MTCMPACNKYFGYAQNFSAFNLNATHKLLYARRSLDGCSGHWADGLHTLPKRRESEVIHTTICDRGITLREAGTFFKEQIYRWPVLPVEVRTI